MRLFFKGFPYRYLLGLVLFISMVTLMLEGSYWKNSNSIIEGIENVKEILNISLRYKDYLLFIAVIHHFRNYFKSKTSRGKKKKKRLTVFRLTESYASLDCCWFNLLLRGFFSRFAMAPTWRRLNAFS
jgi:hypothetical protein